MLKKQTTLKSKLILVFVKMPLIKIFATFTDEEEEELRLKQQNVNTNATSSTGS